MALYINSIKKNSLKLPLSAGATEVVTKLLKDQHDNVLSMATFGEFGTIVVKQGEVRECIKFSNLVNDVAGNKTTLTVATNGRHILPVSPFTGQATGFDFNTGEVIVTNDPLVMSTFANLENANTFNEIQTFAVPPVVPTAVNANQAINKAQMEAQVNLGAADASTSTKGISKLSTAPASPTNPISVGDNDTRVPTQAENDALAGTSGTPSSTNKFVTENDPLKSAPTGVISPFAGFSAPSGWLLADGSAVSRTTYANLLAVLIQTMGTCTMIESGGVLRVTYTAHGLIIGDNVHFSTTGALLTGIEAEQTYSVQTVVDADTFNIGISPSGTQSGVHTLKKSPFIVTPTSFNVPDMRGRVPVGVDTTTDFRIGKQSGAKTHTLTTAEMPAHTHPVNDASLAGGATTSVFDVTTTDNGPTQIANVALSTGGNGAHNNLQPYIALNYIIKF